MATLKFKLQEKDYDEGLIILAKHSKNRMLIQNLTKKKNLGKLEYELNKIAERIKVKPVAPAKTEKAPVMPEKPKKETENKTINQQKDIKIQKDNYGFHQGIRNKYKEFDPDMVPADIKKLWLNNTDAYKEIRSLHEKLKLMEKATPEDRQPLTERITTLEDQIRANWKVIDDWKPGDTNDNGHNNEKIDHKRINANRKFISTNLKKLQEGVEESKAELIRDNLKIRLKELAEAGEKLDPKTIEELSKAGIE